MFFCLLFDKRAGDSPGKKPGLPLPNGILIQPKLIRSVEEFSSWCGSTVLKSFEFCKNGEIGFDLLITCYRFFGTTSVFAQEKRKRFSYIDFPFAKDLIK